jgi:hypothetical protein
MEKGMNAQTDLHEPYLVHPPASPGYFAMLYRPERDANLRQAAYPVQHMKEVLRHWRTDVDAYMSQARFAGRNRRLVSLNGINIAFLDMDSYTYPHLAVLSPEHYVELLLKTCEERGIPLPSLVLFSGRGYYVKWIFTGAVPSRALPKWNAIQHTLADKLEDLGADKRALDASRVLRLINTVNQKSGLRVKIIHEPLGESLCGVRYDFDQFADTVLPYTREEIRAFREKAAVRTSRQQEVSPRVHRVGALTATSLWWARQADIRILATLRYGSSGVERGMRDEFLFLCTNALAWNAEPRTLYHEALSLKNELCPSLPIREAQSYISSVTRRAVDAFKGQLVAYQGRRVDPRYKFTNQTLMERLHITADEEQHMRTIISRVEKRRRELARKERQRRAAGALSREEYQAMRMQRGAARREAALGMREDGLSAPEIARRLNISLRSVRYYLSGGIHSG